MSRIGRKPIPLPAGVKVQIGDRAVEVQGPKGKLHLPLPPGIRI
jgi:large subunit ribosomal protein L6